ncbi:unnamed protein product, partial [Rotaria sordida]
MSLPRLIAKDSWLLRLLANHISYFSFAIPISIIFLISKRSTYKRWPQPIRRIIQLLIRIFISNTFSSSLSDVNNRDEISSPTRINSTTSNFTRHRFFKLIFSVFGLQISYLLWGLLQELSVGPPLFKYGIISYANCMSTWFQYESLLYISFPVQVIAKSIKTVPVMIVGRFVSGKTYPLRQYLLMLLMAF